MAGVKGMKSPRAKVPLEVRFWRHVTQGAPEACWNWTASTNQDGYGRLGVDGPNSKVAAHRLAYELAHGPIPAGLLVCHRCDNPRCCNAAHLFLGTHQDNTTDKVAKDRHVKGEQHGAARLTAEQVRLIRTEDASGRAMAARFNVSPATITRVRRKSVWRHVQ